MNAIKNMLGVFAAASLLLTVNANAQEDNNRDENGKVVRGAYETNKAFDNVFISVSAGVNSVLTGELTPSTWGNLGMETELNFGKWFTPAVGARIGWQGLWNESKDELTLQGIGAGKPFGFNYFHADLLWNISNSIGGYKESRFWSFVPYLTMGALDVSNARNIFIKDAGNNFGFVAGVGLYNVLRLTERVHLTLDVRALVARASAYTENVGYTVTFPSASLGLAFNLGKTGFVRHSSVVPVTVPVPFTTEQYNALADKLAALEKENAALKDKVASLENEAAKYRRLVNGQTYLYENGTFTAVDVQAGSPVSVYFDLGSAQLSAREKAHLEYFAERVVNADTKFSVNGYADKQTGSAATNQKLSEQRVKTVVDFLVKAGAREANIETAAHGSSVQLFDTAAKNRVVTVEVQ